MSEPIKITATVTAWLPPFYSINDLLAALGKGDTQRAVQMLTLTTLNMGKGDSGYVRIGEASVDLMLASQDEMTASQIASLKKQLEQERADSMRRQNSILDQISKLQALEYVEA